MACCSDCAKKMPKKRGASFGASCCKKCAKKRASFGALGFFVPMEAIEGLDGKIRNLDTDIQRIANAPAANNAQLVANARMLSRWTPFRFGWKAWVADHYSTLSRTGPGPVTEFEEKQSQYNELRRQASELGKTSATDSKQDTQGSSAEITSSIRFASVAAVALVAAYLVSKAT